jgi:hypothetical protein
MKMAAITQLERRLKDDMGAAQHASRVGLSIISCFIQHHAMPLLASAAGCMQQLQHHAAAPGRKHAIALLRTCPAA